MRGASLLLVVLLIAYATASVTVSSNCTNLACGECLENYGCGWCAYTRTCMDAFPVVNATDVPMASGLVDNTNSSILNGTNVNTNHTVIPPMCESGLVLWNSSIPVNQTCASCDLSCSDCFARPDCGWCYSMDMCVDAISGQSDNANCTAGFTYETEDVGVACTQCSNFTSCDTCTAQPGCGFCEMDKSCHNGAGDASFDGMCSLQKLSGWLYNTTECITCEIAGCEECVAHPRCGWCARFGEQRCIIGWVGAPDGTCDGSSMNWMFGEEMSDSCPDDVDLAKSYIAAAVGGAMLLGILVAFIAAMTGALVFFYRMAAD